LKKPGPYT